MPYTPYEEVYMIIKDNSICYDLLYRNNKCTIFDNKYYGLNIPNLRNMDEWKYIREYSSMNDILVEFPELLMVSGLMTTVEV